MEVGADKGGSVYTWVKALQPERMIACEIRGTPYSQVVRTDVPAHELLLDGGVVVRSECGRVASSRWLRGHTIDILFLDGDKLAYRSATSGCISLDDAGRVRLHARHRRISIGAAPSLPEG